MSAWLLRYMITFDGWHLSILTLLWIAVSGFAFFRFAPALISAFGVYHRIRKEGIEAESVLKASMERLSYLSSASTTCFMCLLAGILGAHREIAAVIPIILIPVIKLVDAEVDRHLHSSVLVSLERVDKEGTDIYAKG